jgi:CheY-like chemotaxis protein
VDDEAAVREVARRTLAKFGYRVITAAHGAEALRIFQERRQEIQLVLTDMMMPGMDGPALIAALRALDPAVRFVGVTGMSDVESMRGYGSLALSGMLAKPFTIETLLTAVQAALPVAAGKKGSVPAGGKSGSAPPGEI